MSIITYRIFSDSNNRLKDTAKTACNFWNRFIAPSSSIVIGLEVFTQDTTIIAKPHETYSSNGVIYGMIEFNTKYLDRYTDYEIAGVLIHEIGHILGFGGDIWRNLFDRFGRFKSEYVSRIPELKDMLAEIGGPGGTRYNHWDEETFGKELMTGVKDDYEYVLPVTIKVMSLFGHTVQKELSRKTDLKTLIDEVRGIMFTRKGEIEKMKLDQFEKTEISEEVDTAICSKRNDERIGINSAGCC